MRIIRNEELQLSDIPRDDASYEEISGFALTFDAYTHWGSFEKCAQVANERGHGTLTELRTCLFFEQRRWRHFGEAPDEEAMEYIRSLLASIRKRVGTGHRD